MATDIATLSPHDQIGEINKYDFRTESTAVFKARKGLDADIVQQISEMKNEPKWMRDFRLKSLDIFNVEAHAVLGREDHGQFSRHLLLPEAHRRAGTVLGRSSAGHQGHVRETRHPGSGAEVPGGRQSPIRKRSRLRIAERRPGGQGRDLHRHRHGRPRTLGPRPGVFLHDHSAGRQQVRRPQLGGLVGRLVHLRSAGREDRVPAAGLLPHQRREHGPVRADADHRRRGRRDPLCRRLHGPDVQHGKPALGRGRDHRQAGQPAAATRRSRTGPTTSTTW